MRLAGTLSELEWGGWKSMMLPHVLRQAQLKFEPKNELFICYVV